MTKSLILFSALFIAGCAGSMKDLKRTQFKLGHTYLFTNLAGKDHLAVKLLNDTDPKKRRLLAVNRIKPDMVPIQEGEPSIMTIDNFIFDKNGRISFRYYIDEKCTNDIFLAHPVSKAASGEPGGRCSVWYQLDYNKAKLIE